MVISSKEAENVLDRIFLVGVAYDGTIPPLYTKAKSAISNLDRTVLNVYASSVNNAPYAWKRDNTRVLVVDELMFSYEKNTLKNGSIAVIVHEVAENGVIVNEKQDMITQIITETINDYLRKNLLLAS